jgi:serine/threonine-protein kinase
LATQLRRGSKLGKYRLDRRLGRGAFGDVWKARDTVESVDVALKIAHPDALQEWGGEAVEHEARIATRLHHPNIVSVRNADWIGDRFVMATDLAVRDLGHYKKAHRSGKVALDVIRQVARGLAYAHGQKVMHRDLKPDNIMIFADGRAALGDFGASRFSKGATEIYTEAGTLGYVAPEQAYGRVRFGSDVFSLGLIAYEVLTGYLPAWPFEWPPENYYRFEAKVPLPLRPVLRRAAEFQPDKRYDDAVEFSEALEHAFAKLEVPKPKPVRKKRRAKKPPPSPLAAQWAAFRKAHGKTLGLRFECHRCGGPIAEEMVHCPWCGSRDNGFGEVTRYPLVCPECERGVRPEWNHCPWCYAGRFQSNGRKPPYDPQATRDCAARGCDGQLRDFMRYCPRCKRKPKRAWSHPDLPERCPKCRWPTSRDFMRFCPWCGRREPTAGSSHRPRR